MNDKKCKGSRIQIEHYFLSNPNSSIKKKFAENLGYCAVCWYAIPNNSTLITSSWFEKKYTKRTDRYDISPSKDYD